MMPQNECQICPTNNLKERNRIQLQINPQYLELVPRAEPKQLRGLKNSMQKDGQQVKIITNPEGVILDGHTRFMICKELHMEPKYVVRKFDSPEKEKEFVVSVNLNRRHMSLFERGECMLEWWKEEKRRSRIEGGFLAKATRNTGITHGGTVNGKKDRLLNRFSKIIGTSPTSTYELIWLMLHAPESEKEKLRNGEIAIDTAFLKLAKPKRKSRKDYKRDGRVYLAYPKCLNCARPTVVAKDCHVHGTLCCLKCGWGI